MLLNKTLIRPLISEKSLLQAQDGAFTFEVGKEASKEQIKKAVEEAFSVSVVRVRTSTVKGRTSRVWGRRERAAVGPVKKAVIVLKKGQKLDAFELKAG